MSSRLFWFLFFFIFHCLLSFLHRCLLVAYALIQSGCKHRIFHHINPNPLLLCLACYLIQFIDDNVTANSSNALSKNRDHIILLRVRLTNILDVSNRYVYVLYVLIIVLRMYIDVQSTMYTLYTLYKVHKICTVGICIQIVQYMTCIF